MILDTISLSGNYKMLRKKWGTNIVLCKKYIQYVLGLKNVCDVLILSSKNLIIFFYRERIENESVAKIYHPT